MATTENKNTFTRRKALAGLALAPVAVSVPLSASHAFSVYDRGAWSTAVANYKAVAAKVERASAALEKLHDIADARCPREDVFFRRYQMGHGWSRKRNFEAALWSLSVERGRGRTLTDAELAKLDADANRVVDDFEAYSARHDAAFAEYDRQEALFDSLVDRRADAFRAVIDTPAPDNEALLYKLELLATLLEGFHSEDAPTLDKIRLDARRLLTTGRA
ncbi:hypothetical protein LZ016_13785 [Sphingomonas sp. SM33]|uniref:Uncharacterized protein n=1 Tax=Sphingomonas telluris TaxID=2907998 RepID=A0ABS9VRE2_9SPHN|nr:hypothetical protein [Sphingomonas telluris]MCH8617164.1 hypothetical protein [Sphingomonas telluris]